MGARALDRAVHDLHGPLTVIRGLCAGLERCDLRAERRRTVALIDAEVMRLARGLAGLVAPAAPPVVTQKYSSLSRGLNAPSSGRANAVAPTASLAASSPASSSVPASALNSWSAFGLAIENACWTSAPRSEADGLVSVITAVVGLRASQLL